MSEQRFVVETLCEHEELGPHWGRYGLNRSLVECPGGTRRVLDPEQVVVRSYEVGTEYVGSWTPALTVRDIIEALAALEGREP